MLTAAERHQLLVEWNDTHAAFPKDLCIHQLFEAQVEQTPDAVAVVFEDEQLTYGELNRRAHQLAHHLRTLGVGPDTLVGICVERSLEMIVGLLGILKAGGAYVPLDPAYPSERLAYMLSDSQVPVLLTQEKLMSGLSEHQARMVCLDRDWGVTLRENEKNPVSGVKPENLAYVIYTSGSTGKPKGVLVTHQGLCNLGVAQIRLFDLHSDSRVIQFASFSFDASISEIVMALCSGAMLCLGTRESLLPGPSLRQFLLEHAITHMTLPPSALATLPTEELPALQNIIVAGEAGSTGLVAQWSKGRRFFNAYGPTESTVCGTVYMIPSAIVKLEALPLTPNGKVDRRALLAPDTARPELQEAFVAPRDTLELQLALIWEDVLNVRPIGVTDNFFTLGGHSLLAVRLIALLQQQFEQNLPLATLVVINM
jgi:amino acid adenylation domain-containing protein